MTADMVLRGRPLPAAGPGPVIAVAAADAAAYARDQRQGQSVVRVAAGEKLTGRQALEAMLIPSGNNIASLLARWDAGSEAAFAAKMNTRARQLGLHSTRYADASGADPATVSTAASQFRLTVAALQIPAFRQIVAMPQVRLPAWRITSTPAWGTTGSQASRPGQARRQADAWPSPRSGRRRAARS